MWLGYIYKEVLFSLCLDIIVVSINPYKQSKDTCILIWGLEQAPKKHFGLRVCSSVIHYIACDGGSFEICNYDIELEEKNRSHVLLWVLVWLHLYWWKKRGGGGGGGETDNLGKCWYKVRLTCTSHNPCFHPIDKFCS